jgi:hypothetical protein
MSPDEAKATIDRFAAADSSTAAIAAVAKQLIEQVATDAAALSETDRRELDALREKQRVEREKDNAYRRQKRREKPASVGCPSDAKTSVGCPSDALPSRARSSSILEEKIDDDDDDDPRARDEKISIEQLADTVEQITRENGKLPIGGWNRSVLIAWLQKHIRASRSPQLIIGTVRGVTARAPIGGPINSLDYFDQQIARDHATAMAQLRLPLVASVAGSGAASNGKPSNIRNYLDASIAAAEASERRAGIGDADAAEIGGASGNQGAARSVASHEGP